jgi:predicted methyltransferase
MLSKYSIAFLFLSLLVIPAYTDHHESALAKLEMALASESRSERDRARDAGRKPAQVIEFLGIGSGMIVVDMYAASGFYTEVLSLAVGSEGKVYAQNPARMLQFRDGANEKAISARLAGGRLTNVERLNKELSGLGLEENSIDAVITALNFHDIYNGAGPEAALGSSKVIYSILKPNGVFGVIDHQGNSGNDNASLHRIEVALAVKTLKKAGFKVQQSDLLSNPDDTHDKGVFDPSVRGKTDRFLLLARKPG